MCEVLCLQWKTESLVPMYALKTHNIKSAIPASATPSMNNWSEGNHYRGKDDFSFKMLRILMLSESMGKEKKN